MPAKLVQQLGTGRRKTATARVFLRPGKGQITVNHRPFENYFVNESARAYVRQPLLAAEMADRFDILILADGGGVTGQAGAAQSGICACYRCGAVGRWRLREALHRGVT